MEKAFVSITAPLGDRGEKLSARLRSRVMIMSIMLAIIWTMVPSFAQEITSSPAWAAEIVPLAETFVDRTAQGDYAAAASVFDETMTRVFPADMLKATWAQLQGQVGAFKDRVASRTAEQQGYRIVFVTCEFEKSLIDVRVVFDSRAKLAGLQFLPAQAPAPKPYEPPPYVDATKFSERNVTVGSGTWALPGTLSLPNGPAPFPAVVLVHGSGPNDRDESVLAEKPFRDLAWGLASRGIAVLRYDKRTKAHAPLFTPETLAKLTVNEETVDDALLAVELLRGMKEIDPRRVYVLGHSLGAMVAPRIGARDRKLAGLVVLAGPARPLEDLILEQVTYLYALGGGTSPDDDPSLNDMRKKVARVKDAGLSATIPSTDLPLGLPANYWLDLRDYKPAEAAKNLSTRFLILQGGRDYQVSAERDFPLWQAALEGNADATLKLYPGLNHLFIAGSGAPSPAEYDVPGHVSEEAVTDIAEWITKKK
jgi:dienelactone hydrolase